jgi:SAM-dependent MidA family methyltransferase
MVRTAKLGLPSGQHRGVPVETLRSRILGEIGRVGRITFARYMELVLYEPRIGFYSAHRKRGPGTDFATAPEISPLFGCLVAAHALQVWIRASSPPNLRIVELGGGPKNLARQIGWFFGFVSAGASGRPPITTPLLAAIRTALGVDMLPGLPRVSYLIVDPSIDEEDHSPESWVPSQEGIPLAEEMSVVASSDLQSIPPPGQKYRCCTLVVANEVFDNVPSRVVIRDRGSVSELCVTVENGRLSFEAVPEESLEDLEPTTGWRSISSIPDELCARISEHSLRRFSPDAEIGMTSSSQFHLALEAASIVDKGGVLIFDLLENPAGSPIVTYSSHRQGFDPFEDPGNQDIMVPVQWGQIRAALEQSDFALIRLEHQADWLLSCGLEAVIRCLARAYSDSASKTKGAITTEVEARSLIVSAKALCDPVAFGGFGVLGSSKL